MTFLENSKWLNRKTVESNIFHGVYLHVQSEVDCIWHKIESVCATPNGSFKYHICRKGVWQYISASSLNGFLTQAKLTDIVLEQLKTV